VSEYQRRRATEEAEARQPAPGERPDNLLYAKWEAEAKQAARDRKKRRKEKQKRHGEAKLI
jgi:hypothetical protein